MKISDVFKRVLYKTELITSSSYTTTHPAFIIDMYHAKNISHKMPA